MTDLEPPRRRASDFEKPRTAMDWVRANSVLVGAAAIIFVGIAGTAVFYTRLSDMIPVVVQMRKDIDEAQGALTRMRADITLLGERTAELKLHLDKTIEQAELARWKIQEAAGAAATLGARQDERIKNLEIHLAPLPLYLPGKGPPR